MTPIQLRLANVVASIAYLLLFISLYESYISIKWAYLLLVYYEPSLWTVVKMVGLVSIAALSLSGRVDRPSSIVVWFLFAFVFVPTVAVSNLITYAPERFDLPILAMTAVFVASGFILSDSSPRRPAFHHIPEVFVLGMTAIWAVLSLLLFMRYFSILSFAGLDNVYEQRDLAAETKVGVLFSYGRTYYAAVFSPVLMAYGLAARRYQFLALGLLGSGLGYAIAAEKAALILPIIMLGIWQTRRMQLAYTPLYTASIAGLSAFCALLTNHTVIARYFADLILMRAIAVPGQTLSQYHDYFTIHGHTWWSHVRGISSIVPAPTGLSRDPQWPELGRMIGGAFFGFSSGQNSNANLFVSDGVAAGGWIGVLIIGAALVGWLRVLDFSTRQWPSTLVILLLVPVAMALTNGPLTTVLLSFGGLFWTAVFLITYQSLNSTNRTQRSAPIGRLGSGATR
tara:strand:+ start:11037 stop:12398 length:1362 start_codon:yes stop_codon:yes gene_type:complete